MGKLPSSFLQKMESLLKEEYPLFLASYGEPRRQGIRANGLKIGSEELRRLLPYPVSDVPWAEGGLYAPETERPGKHPYYHAGLYYVQEPSAMAPVELLQVRPGERVLDLCAAPGGKTTQIAAKLQGQGLVVANDNQPDRVKALVKNVELYGITNAIVLNETPERIAVAMPRYFDKILVDAPCSGEGMFRKDETMAKGWSEQSPAKYAAMQAEILDSAAAMLAPGGRMVYSTCTFSPEENEQMIAGFLRKHPAFRLEPIEPSNGFAPGRPDWSGQPYEGGSEEAERCGALSATVRLWPHRLAGEGHYAAVLQLSHEVEAEEAARATTEHESRMDAWTASGRRRPHQEERLRQKNRSADRNNRSAGRGNTAEDEDAAEAAFRAFTAAHLHSFNVQGDVRRHRDYLYIVPSHAPSLDGLKAVRPGWFVGTMRSGRFEPSHPLALGLKRDSNAVRSLSFEPEDPNVVRYLKGETLQVPEERLRLANPGANPKGYCLVCVQGWPLGWGKWQDGMLKNEYPPGWRWS